MTPESQILFPQKELKIGDESFVVRELAWSEALDFLKKLGGYLGSLMNDKGELVVTVSGLTDLISNTQELSATLVAKATGRTAESFENLSLGQMLDLIDAALELNLSEEIIAKGKNIAGRFQRFAGKTPRMATPASAQPMTTSSGKVTAERT